MDANKPARMTDTTVVTHRFPISSQPLDTKDIRSLIDAAIRDLSDKDLKSLRGVHIILLT